MGYPFRSITYWLTIFIASSKFIAPAKASLDSISPDKISEVFPGLNGSVPKYEVIKIRISRGPTNTSTRNIVEGIHFEMRAFGENIDLWLDPGEGILVHNETPVFVGNFSATEAQNVQYTKLPGLMARLGVLYEDSNTRTSLLIKEDAPGNFQVTGEIRDRGIAITLLPRSFLDPAERYRRSSDNSTSDNSNYHIVYKTNLEYEFKDSHQIKSRRDVDDSGNVTTIPPLPDYFYPEVLVVIDYSTFQYHSDIEESEILNFLKYIVTFWNGVDLLYRSLTSPNIRFNIAGIVLSDGPKSTPYLYDNMITPTRVNSSETIENAITFFYIIRNSLPVTFDVVTTMTKLELISDASLVVPDEGVALFQGGCKISDRQKRYYSIAIFHDNGAFKGIRMAAHELGHILGLIDEFDFGNCHTLNGHIMGSWPVYTTNSSDFSWCSRRILHLHFQRNRLACMYNKPDGNSLPRILPGKLKDLQAQCRALNAGDPCQFDERVCLRLHCIKEGVCTEMKLPAVDGSKCHPLDLDKFCLHMQCVTK